MVCFSKKPRFEDHYEWWSTKILEYKECTLEIVRIHAENNNTDVFRPGCKPTEEKCIVSNSIIVWNKRVIHDCPYEIIKPNLPFHRKGNVMISNTTRHYRFLFQIEKKLTVCQKNEIEIFKTTTGLYLAKTYRKPNIQSLRITNTQENSALQMITAENDYNNFEEIKITNEEYEQDCIEFFNLIKIVVITMNDQFLRLTDYTGNEMVLYI